MGTGEIRRSFNALRQLDGENEVSASVNRPMGHGSGFGGWDTDTPRRVPRVEAIRTLARSPLDRAGVPSMPSMPSVSGAALPARRDGVDRVIAAVDGARGGSG
jgi:hypothetical protein